MPKSHKVPAPPPPASSSSPIIIAIMRFKRGRGWAGRGGPIQISVIIIIIIMYCCWGLVFGCSLCSIVLHFRTGTGPGGAEDNGEHNAKPFRQFAPLILLLFEWIKRQKTTSIIWYGTTGLQKEQVLLPTPPPPLPLPSVTFKGTLS